MTLLTSAGLESDLIPVKGGRCLCSLPGTQSVLVGTDSGLKRIDLVSHEVEEVACSIKDKWGSPVAFSAMVGLSDSRLLGASINTAYFLAITAGKVKQERKVSLRSKVASASSITAAADGSGTVGAVSASDYLVGIARTGKRPMDKTESSDWDRHFSSVAISRDGSKLANGRGDGEIQIRDPQTFDVAGTLEGLKAPVLSMAFSPDGRYLVAGDDTTRTFLWDLDGGAATQLEGMGKVIHLSWLSDGSGIVAADLTRQFCVFDVQAPAHPKHSVFPEDLGTRYFLSAGLIDDSTLAILVEDSGVLIARA